MERPVVLVVNPHIHSNDTKRIQASAFDGSPEGLGMWVYFGIRTQRNVVGVAIVGSAQDIAGGAS